MPGGRSKIGRFPKRWLTCSKWPYRKKTLDLVERIIAEAESLHVHPVDIAQFRAILHAERGEIEKAVENAYEARYGHGCEFAGMCAALFKSGADVGDLCDTLYDCMIRYHEGHGPCSAWTLLLLLRHGRIEQFENGLRRIAASAHDYRQELESRREVRSSVAAVKLYRARQDNNTEEELQLRREIESMPFFSFDVASALYELVWK